MSFCPLLIRHTCFTCKTIITSKEAAVHSDAKLFLLEHIFFIVMQYYLFKSRTNSRTGAKSFIAYTPPSTPSHTNTHTGIDSSFYCWLNVKARSMPLQHKVWLLLHRHVNAQRWRAGPSVHGHVHLFHRFILSIHITIYTGLFL